MNQNLCGAVIVVAWQVCTGRALKALGRLCLRLSKLSEENKKQLTLHCNDFVPT